MEVQVEPEKKQLAEIFCESPKETHENCPDDCCPPSGCTDDLEEREEIKEELNGGEKMADESEERGSILEQMKKPIL